MDPEVGNFVVVMIVIVGVVGCLAGIVMWTFRSFHKIRQPQFIQQPNFDQQLAQLQQSVDSIAVEVERIAEAQRFSTKLLADGARGTTLKELR